MKLEVFAIAALLTTSIAASVPAIALTEHTLPDNRYSPVPSLKMPTLATFSDVSPLPKQDWQLSLALEK
jgi:hypothetical protein